MEIARAGRYRSHEGAGSRPNSFIEFNVLEKGAPVKTTTRILGLLAAVAAAGTLSATMDDQKAFAAKYPDAKALAKCTTCHTAAMPKKGAAELNGYGKD